MNISDKQRRAAAERLIARTPEQIRAALDVDVREAMTIRAEARAVIEALDEAEIRRDLMDAGINQPRRRDA